MNILVVDCLASGKGTRIATRDAIGSGPRTIAGVLEKLDHEPKIVPVEDILGNKIPFENFNLLLVSGMTNDLPAIQKATRIWKKEKSNPVIIGGPVGSEPVRVLTKTSAEISVTGEGESTISELFETELAGGIMPRKRELQAIMGIAYRVGEEIEVNPFRPIQSRDIFTHFQPSTKCITDYPLFYAARVYVEVLRGCSNFHRARIGSFGANCTYCEICTQGELEKRYNCPQGIPPGCGYCSVPSLYGPPRTRSKNLVLNEVKELLKLGVTRIVLSAPGFLDYGRDLIVEPEPLADPRKPAPNYELIEKLLKELTSIPKVTRGEASIMIENVKASLVTEIVVDILGKYLYDTPVSIGFETGDSEQSRLIGRPDTPSETLKAIRRLSLAGLRPYVYFIHGLPGQTEATVDATIDMIYKSAKLGARRIILYRFYSLPMSAFMDCPSGPPSALDPQSKRIYEAARNVNEDKKESLLGNKMKVVIAEKYNRDKNYLVAYPMNHGPVVLIEGDTDLVRKVVTVEVDEIASDRMVYGRLIK